MGSRRRVSVELFCEDSAHEDCARALIHRCAQELELDTSIRTATARFGIPRLKAELRAFQDTARRTERRVPDILVVLIDANRGSANARRKEVADLVDPAVFPTVITGVPEPYVERWFLADPPSFAQCFGVTPKLSGSGDRSVWKRRLLEALQAAGRIVTQGGAEFAPEIIEAMDLYRAGKAVPSLGAFVSDLRGALRRHASE